MKLENYIAKNYLKFSDRQIAERFNISRSYVSNTRKKLGIKIPEAITKKRRAAACGFRHNTEHDAFIRKHYLATPPQKIADQIGRSEVFVKTAIRFMGLEIPREIIDQRKLDARIKKGAIPPNKGKKMSPEQYAIASKTFFKKGQKPINELPEIAITIRKDLQFDGSTRKYWWIKLGYKKYKMYHVHIWEREHGSVPEGFIIVFKDKNSLNCIIENLEIITLAENMRRNTIARFPLEVRQVITLTHKLNKKIHAKQNH